MGSSSWAVDLFGDPDQPAHAGARGECIRGATCSAVAAAPVVQLSLWRCAGAVHLVRVSHRAHVCDEHTACRRVPRRARLRAVRCERRPAARKQGRRDRSRGGGAPVACLLTSRALIRLEWLKLREQCAAWLLQCTPLPPAARGVAPGPAHARVDAKDGGKQCAESEGDLVAWCVGVCYLREELGRGGQPGVL